LVDQSSLGDPNAPNSLKIKFYSKTNGKMFSRKIMTERNLKWILKHAEL